MRYVSSNRQAISALVVALGALVLVVATSNPTAGGPRASRFRSYRLLDKVLLRNGTQVARLLHMSARQGFAGSPSRGSSR